MNKNNFLTGNIAPALIKFTLPLMLSLVLQALYGAVDLMIVGMFGSTSSVAAVATGSHVMQTLTVIITGLTMGVTVLIGQAIGMGDKDRISWVIGGQIKLFSIIAILITFFTIIFAEKAVEIMNVPPEAVKQTVAYIRICASGMIFITAYNGISGIFRGLGNSKSPLLFVFIACICNIILDIIFVKFLKMEASGAALATVMAQGISVAFSVYYIRKSNLPFKLSKDIFRKFDSVKAILKIGFPISLQDFLVGISFLIITGIVNSLGVVASASIGVAEKLFIFLALVPMSFMSAISAFVAQNVGAKQYKRAKKALFIASVISFSVGVCMFLATFFHGDVLASLFTKDIEVIAATASYLNGSSYEYLFVSLLFCLLGYFNGLGKTTFVMMQGLSTSFLIRIPLSLYISNLPETSMYLISFAVPISSFASLALSVIYLLYLGKKEGKS